MRSKVMEPQSATAGDGSVLDELMTTDQVAASLQMRVSTVEYYARQGVLPSLKLGRHRRFLRSGIEEAVCAAAATGDRQVSIPVLGAVEGRPTVR